MGFLSLFSKGDPPPPQQLKAPPPPTKMESLTDNIGGAKYDAKTNSIIRLPRNEQMQEMYDQGLRMIRNGMESLSNIANNYPDLVPSIIEPLTVLTDTLQSKRNELAQVLDMPNFEQHLQNLRTAQITAINDHYDISMGEGLNRLASMGYGAGSSAAASYIDMAQSSKSKAMQEMEGQIAQKALDYQSQYNQNAAQRANTVVGLNDSIAQNSLTQNQLENQQFGMQQQTADKKFIMADSIQNKGTDMLRYDAELPLKSNVFGNALALKQAEDNYKLGATSLENQAIKANNDANLAHHNAKSQPFLGQLVSGALTAYTGGATGGLGSLAGQAMGEKFGFTKKTPLTSALPKVGG